MARQDRSKPTSKSALQQQDDAEAARLLDLPLLSIAGLRARWKKVATLAIAAVLLFTILGVLIVQLSAPANFEVVAAAPFGQAKAGEPFNFSVTVRNSALFSAFAYETHVLGLPSGWTASSGDDLFALRAGESRAVTVSVLTGGATPPNHDYPMELKVFVKSPDRHSVFANKTLPLTVKLLSSNLRLNLETRQTLSTFSDGQTMANLTYATCDAPIAGPTLLLPFNANVTSGALNAAVDLTDPNGTGALALDLGADGTNDAFTTFLGTSSRTLSFTGAPLNSYLADHPAAAGDIPVPTRWTACLNATATTIALSALVLSLHTPAPAGTVVPITVVSPNLPQAEARLFINVRNDEPRDLSVVFSIPGMPTGWETAPSLANSPVFVPAHGQNGLEFLLHVAKTAPVGPLAVNFSGCLQTNPSDCVDLSLALDMPGAPFYTVKAYVEPAQLKEVFKGRHVDVVLFAQNLGNQFVTFAPDVLVRAGLDFSWWNGSGDLGPTPTFGFDAGQRLVFVLTIKAAASSSATFASLNPIFRNQTLGIVQAVQLSVNVQDPPAAGTPSKVGDTVTVQYTGLTAAGLLFDTNQVGMVPLVDSKQRPTHPQFVKPTGAGQQPFQFTIGPLSNYTQQPHKGFEPYLTGALERETVVLWLTPDKTVLPDSAILRDETLVFEITVSRIVAV
jgi:hypothetical protein